MVSRLNSRVFEAELPIVPEGSRMKRLLFFTTFFLALFVTGFSMHGGQRRQRTVGQDFSRKGSVCFRTAKQFTKSRAHFSEDDEHTDLQKQPDFEEK